MRGAESKIAILNAAVEAFSTQSYNGVSIRDIAKAANVNHAIIRYHFGSKEDLWLAVFQHLLAATASLRTSSPFDKEAKDLKLELRKFIRSRIAHVAKHPALLKIILLEVIDGGPRFTQIDTLMRTFFRRSLDIIKDMQEVGIVRNFKREDLFYVIPLIIGGRFIYTNIEEDFEGNSISIDSAVDAHTDILMKMVCMV